MIIDAKARSTAQGPRYGIFAETGATPTRFAALPRNAMMTGGGRDDDGVPEEAAPHKALCPPMAVLGLPARPRKGGTMSKVLVVTQFLNVRTT